jgi:hypothetical protein
MAGVEGILPILHFQECVDILPRPFLKASVCESGQEIGDEKLGREIILGSDGCLRNGWVRNGRELDRRPLLTSS